MIARLHVRKENRCVRGFGEKPKENRHLEDLGVDQRIILKWIFKKMNGSVEWIDLAGVRTGGGF
jgi:hypothetical protein